MILRLSLHLPEDASYIRTTRLLSRCLLEDMKVNRPVIDDVETIVAELCANVVRHAHSEAPYFLMTLEYYKPKVVITVTDEGQGFARADVLPVGSERSDGLGGAPPRRFRAVPGRNAFGQPGVQHDRAEGHDGVRGEEPVL